MQDLAQQPPTVSVQSVSFNRQPLSEKFLDIGTVTRPPSNIYARLNCSVIRHRCICTRVQGHPRNLFRRPWIFGLLSTDHHTWPYQASVLWYGGKLLFSNAAAKIPKAISQKRDDGCSFLNDGNLDKCLSEKKIRLATPALWLSSPHWAKCMTNYYPSRSPSKRHAKTTALIRRRPVTWVYLDRWISQTVSPERSLLVSDDQENVNTEVEYLRSSKRIAENAQRIPSWCAYLQQRTRLWSRAMLFRTRC